MANFLERTTQSFLTTLAFAESPERYQVSGEFDVSRFHFTKATRERATREVAEFIQLLTARGVALGDSDPAKVGAWMAYGRNHHGTGIADDLDPKMAGPMIAAFDGVADSMGEIYLYFRKRRGKVEMAYDASI